MATLHTQTKNNYDRMCKKSRPKNDKAFIFRLFYSIASFREKMTPEKASTLGKMCALIL